MPSRLRPNFAEALSNRGNVLQALGRWTEAVESYDRTLALQPDSADALSNRGAVLLRLNRYEEALASLDRAVAIRPQFSGALSNRGLVLRQLHRFDEALASFAAARAALKSNAEAHFGEGRNSAAARRFRARLGKIRMALTRPIIATRATRFRTAKVVGPGRNFRQDYSSACSRVWATPFSSPVMRRWSLDARASSSNARLTEGACGQCRRCNRSRRRGLRPAGFRFALPVAQSAAGVRNESETIPSEAISQRRRSASRIGTNG